MTARLINIVGASGTGTTTLGQALARHVGFDFLDADDLYWLPTTPPYRSKRARDERLVMVLDRIAASSGTVLSGSVVRWGEPLEDAFDLIVLLVVPTEVRLARLRAREQRELGAVDEDFLSWAALYDDGDLNVRSRALHEHWLAARTCPVLRIEGTPAVQESLARALEAIAEMLS